MIRCRILYRDVMSDSAKLSHTAALILQTVDNGCSYGFDIMDETGLPSGTVYPALRRMETEGLVSSQWEAEKKALAEQRPARKYYRVTRLGSQVLEHSQKRYPLLGKLSPKSRR
jgi:PadR family transcriptional regulator PadR